MITTINGAMTARSMGGVMISPEGDLVLFSLRGCGHHKGRSRDYDRRMVEDVLHQKNSALAP